ncbi:MAG TPA: hypothetical protein VGL91_19500 [Acidobacteriota bacterium]|jgi:hypothetical protein
MNRFASGALLVILILAALWRFADLDRDPPAVTGEAGSWIDPGHYLYNARTRVLFHEWRFEEGSDVFFSQGYTFLATLWFRILGPGYRQAVLLSTLAGFLIIAATGLWSWAAIRDRSQLSKVGAGCAAIASLLLSYVMFALQHVPKADMESVAICSTSAAILAGLDVFESDVSMRWFKYPVIISGLGIGLAPFVKIYSALFSLACLMAWCVSYFLLDSQWKRIWRRATPFLAVGLAISALVWVSWILWLVRWRLFGAMAHEFSWVFEMVTPSLVSPRTAAGRGGFAKALVISRFLQSNLFYRQPVETVLATVAACRFLFLKRRNWPLLLAFTWLVVGFFSLSIIEYAPLRFRTLFLPPAIVLAASMWVELALGKLERLDTLKTFASCAAAGIVLGYTATYCLSIRLPWFLNAFAGSRFYVAVSFLGLIAATSVWLALERLPGKGVASVLALAAVLVALPQWWNGEQGRTHEQHNIAERLASAYPNAVLGGVHGADLALRTKLDAYLFWTPTAVRRVTLVVDPPSGLRDVPLKLVELERHELRPIKVTVAIALVQR